MKSVITISRQYGSGGRKIGMMLGERLGIPVYDKELINMAARESGMAKELFEQNDEKVETGLFHSYTQLNERLYLAQFDTIKKIAKEGPCIIVGRCADYVLRKLDNRCAVFIHAPLQDRIDRAIKEYGVPQDKAAAVVSQHDKQRMKYHNYYADSQWGDVRNYQLAVDSGWLGVEGAVDLIEACIKLREAKIK